MYPERLLSQWLRCPTRVRTLASMGLATVTFSSARRRCKTSRQVTWHDVFPPNSNTW